MQSLDEAGTTWQKAARYKMVSDLAALAGEDDGSGMVASPDDENP